MWIVFNVLMEAQYIDSVNVDIHAHSIVKQAIILF